MIRRDRVRIVYCEQNTDGTVGGSYYSLLYLVKGLDRARFAPVVVFYTEHALIPAFRDAGIETLVWRKPRPFSFASGGAAGARDRRLAMLLQKALNVVRGLVVSGVAKAWYIRTRGFDLVHLNNSVIRNHDWMLAARLARRPCLTHERGINSSYPRLARFFGRRLAAIVCISEAVRQSLVSHGVDFGNLVTISNGLDPDLMHHRLDPQQIRASHGIEPDAPLIVMVGNVKAWKGQDTLVRAMDRVRRSMPQARVIIVGATSPADAEYARQLTALIASLELERHVVLAGYRENVPDYLYAAQIVVHASVLPEPFGRVLLEAMACRRPVLAANAGGVPEIVEDGQTGLLFRPGDSDGLSAALLQLLGNPESMREMGERGYQRLVDHFHVKRNVEATAALYERIVHGHG